MADPVGISVSDDAVMTAAPTWTRLDNTYNVTGYQVDRGRSYELEKTGTGTATIVIQDKTGAFDPTQSPLVDVMHHVAICLQNPLDSSWGQLFRGFVSSVNYQPHQTTRVAEVRIECVDALALLAAMEMTPDGTFGDAVVSGNIVFDAQDFTDGVQRRIGDGSTYTGVLSQAGWPATLRQVFTGNVWLQRTVYPPRASVLQVLQDAADAEFPGVANVYVNRFGHVTFHGRLARFDPDTTSDGTDWDFHRWDLGDDAAVLIDPTTTVRISPPLEAFRDDSNLFTSSIATPQNIADADIAAQYAEDAGAVTTYGRRTWSAENLATGAQDTAGSTTALEATARFRDYYLANYKQPRTRVGQVTVKGQRPSGVSGPPNWAFLCGVDISDVCHLGTSHFGYTAFDDYFYVEGVRYDVKPGNGAYPDVTCTVDLSPFVYFDSNPF